MRKVKSSYHSPKIFYFDLVFIGELDEYCVPIRPKQFPSTDNNSANDNLDNNNTEKTSFETVEKTSII